MWLVVIKSYSARNIPLHRRGVFIYKNGEGSTTFPPQGFQYVQRCKFVDFYDGYATVNTYKQV